MITSDGFEITCLPLMYPYNGTELDDSETVVIDMQNHSLTWANSNVRQQNMASMGIQFSMMDGETQSASGNAVGYKFSRFDTTPSTPADPDTDPDTK